MIGRRVRYVELTVPRTSTILLPDVRGMKHHDEVVSFMDSALQWSRNDELRAHGLPLVGPLAARFRDATNDADQDATLLRMCRTTCYLGFAAAAQEIADFQPPPFRVHPIVHTALAQWCAELPPELFPGDLNVMGAYCIRAGHYVGRTNQVSDLFA
ncbi:MAG TPA: hypothetical protein VGL75_05405 [Acidothermaceae bacterium]